VVNSDFEIMWERAQRLLNDAALARFFDPKRHVKAANEVAYVNASGDVRRIDRLVEFEDEVWILDYKTGELPGDADLLTQYEAQLREYGAAMSGVAAGRTVHAMLLFSNGEHRTVI
jgi:ATP-dependent helicase/nuclease subunit A